MPWDIKRSGSSYQVVQRDNGKVVGRHSSRSAAERQQAALYASEKEEKAAQPTRNMWHGQFFPRRG
jgi:hypothetical protein